MKGKKTSIENVLSTAQIIMLGFLIVIAIGTILLMMPFCSATGQVTGFVDALFTATTSVCVTGLVVVPTYAYWSLIGKVVIALLIQIGGLGFMTCFTLVLFMLRRKITLKERLTIQDSLGESHLSGLLKVVVRIIRGTLFIEGIGALFYAIHFVPEHGFVGGIGRAVFTAISAFCNAGIDLVGDYSLMPYATNPLVGLTTCFLIVTGGIGFPVWWDMIKTGKERRRAAKKKRKLPKSWWQMLALHSKLAISSTIVLLFSGTVLIFLFEYSNPATIGEMSFGNKLLNAFFQSVTTRTAGFFTIHQADLTLSSKILSVIFMFIGGSPVGTAGGIKTVTVVVLFMAMVSVIRGKERTEVFGRTISMQTVRKSLALVMIYMAVLISGVMLLSVAIQSDSLIELSYEVTSALATVGLTLGITPSLNVFGKLIIIVCMYIGRIGPISLAIAFIAKQKKTNNAMKYPEENIMVG